MFAPDPDAFEPKHVAQHPAAQERPFQVQLRIPMMVTGGSDLS